MNTKNILSVFLSLAFMLVLVASVSAFTLSSPSKDITQGSNQTTVTLSNTNTTQNVTVSVANIVDGANLVSLIVSPTSISNFANGATQTLTVTGTSFSPGFKFGRYTSILTATGTTTNSSGATLTVSSNATITYFKTFCKNGEVGTNLTISDVNINNDRGDDFEWKPLDKIKVDVDVDNNGDNNIRNVQVEIELLDSSGKTVVKKLEFSDADDQKKDIGTINENDHEKATFEFVVPADFDEGNYKLAVKAYSKTLGEDKMCADTSSTLSDTSFQTVEVIRESDKGKFIVFDNIKFSPTEATCTDSVTLSFDAVNVGDQDQDQVRVFIKSSALKIDTSVEIRDNLNQGDKKTLSYTFDVPAGLADKLYTIELSSEYDYRKSTDSYKESSDNAKQVLYKVFGCTPVVNAQNKVTINAALTSDAQAGLPLTVKATVTNNQGTSGIFSVSVKGYESWSDLDTVSDRIVQLANGQSKDITLSFNVDEKASGEQSFILETKSDSGETQQKEIVVNVEPKAGFSLGNAFEGNGLIWVIGIINVILIVLIIVVAVKLSNR
ncbi:MAG: putative S-layer protein [Nanoarchaeota archaeon]|nr:putative S-layer protein [Nanoarchaeota archaeon]